MRNGEDKTGKFKKYTEERVHISDKGYLRIGTKGEHRNKYVHRRVLEVLLENPLCARYVFPVVGKIPSGMTVHHVDHRNTHNCHGNLQLLDDRIHRWIERDYRKYIVAHYEEWVEFNRKEYENEVPF